MPEEAVPAVNTRRVSKDSKKVQVKRLSKDAARLNDTNHPSNSAYYNKKPDDPVASEVHRVKVTSLYEYVTGKHPDSFADEFMVCKTYLIWSFINTYLSSDNMVMCTKKNLL